jgi:hypothetical protein
VVIQPISPQTRAKPVGFVHILDGVNRGKIGESGESYQVWTAATSRTFPSVVVSPDSMSQIDLELLVSPPNPEILE